MRVRSAIFSEMSGTLNGTVAARTRGGTVIRTRKTPVNPRSARQMVVRNALTACSQVTSAWDLSTYLLWAAFAKPLMITSSVGDSFAPTPQQAFNHINLLRAQLGLAVVTTPPTPLVALSPTTIDFANPGDPLQFHYSGAADPADDCLTLGGGLIVYSAIRPITHSILRGGWDHVEIYRGASPRVAEATPLDVGITHAAEPRKYFIRISGSTPNGTRMPDFDLVHVV